MLICILLLPSFLAVPNLVSADEQTDNAAAQTTNPLENIENYVRELDTTYRELISPAYTNNAYQAASILVANGYSTCAASAVVGNLMNDKRWQGGSADIDPALNDGSVLGIGRWTGDEKTAYLTWCSENGLEWSDLNAQVTYLMGEIQEKWANATSCASIVYLADSGTTVYTDLSAFMASDDMDAATMSFYAVYDDQVNPVIAKGADYSSLDEWIAKQKGDRVAYTESCLKSFFKNEFSYNIKYASYDIRQKFTKVAKEPYVVADESAPVFTSADRNADVAGVAYQGSIVYRLLEEGEWYYIESGSVRGFILAASLYSAEDSQAIIEGSGGEWALSNATPAIPITENPAAYYTWTTVYCFRNPYDQEVASYAASEALASGATMTNEQWMRQILAFYGKIPIKGQYSTGDLLLYQGTPLDLSGVQAGNIVTYSLYDVPEKILYAVYNGDGTYTTIEERGTVNTQLAIPARCIFAVYDLFPEEYNNGVPYYYQADYPDVPYNTGSVATDGCGVTCFAMVASYLTGQHITPADVGSWGYANNVNTVVDWSAYQTLADNYGIQLVGEAVGPMKGGSAEDIVNALHNGCIVIASITGGYFNPSDGGHYIAYVGITDDNMIYVSDPGSRERSFIGAPFDVETALAACKEYWVFTK